MSILRIKASLLTAVCIGLIGLTSSSAAAFGGKLFGKKSDCNNSCDSCAAPAGGSGTGNTEWVQTWVEETVNVMKPTQVTETYTAYRYECVPETVTKQVMVNKMVTQTTTILQTLTFSCTHTFLHTVRVAW